MKTKKAKKLYNFILIVFLILSSTFLFNNKTIEKEIKTSKKEIKALDQEGQNYRLVTSADNVQVPVPKGYVASQVTGENYVTPEYQHTTNTYKVSSTVLTWSSPEGEQYPWTQDGNGIWISGNQGIHNSESVLESEEFDYIKGTTLTINYIYSSASGDYLNIKLINLTENTSETIVNYKYGNTYDSFDYTTQNYVWTMDNGRTGRYKIRVTYRKDSSTDGGQDSSYIKPSTYFKEDENGETIEVDQKTKIHDGGFVIYQLTDEELETDPNGTSVIVNDTNKEEAQRVRNQYVWVPIPNIEDITRTKTANNGIMQFGQNYTFTTTSIIKETGIESEYFREPRLSGEYDKTKKYLQIYTKMNTRENYLNNMQEEYTRMVKSINKYKGFYIGRYETGDDISHDNSKGYFKNPKNVRYNRNIAYVTWYNTYKDLERISGKTEKYVETGMLYDSLYDYTLKWFNETDTRSYEEIRSDSGTWGNVQNNTKISTSGGAFPEGTGAIETIIYKGEVYSDNPTASNNIFDIAGNVFEWTRSLYSFSNRRLRGGYYGPAYYISNSGSASNYYEYGARSMLIIR